jgi:hypothetical protein
MVIRNGPDAREEDLFPHVGLVLGFDPVAVDAVSNALLLSHRRKVGLTDPLDVRYLKAADELSVGRQNGHDLEQIVITG